MSVLKALQLCTVDADTGGYLSMLRTQRYSKKRFGGGMRGGDGGGGGGVEHTIHFLFLLPNVFQYKAPTVDACLDVLMKAVHFQASVRTLSCVAYSFGRVFP